jgi:hypothetical protein
MVKLETGTPFNPDEYKGREAETFDPLGTFISDRHQIVAEHCPLPDGERLWEVQCKSCRHAYLLSDSKRIRVGAVQPCRCTMRKGR